MQPTNLLILLTVAPSNFMEGPLVHYIIKSIIRLGLEADSLCCIASWMQKLTGKTHPIAIGLMTVPLKWGMEVSFPNVNFLPPIFVYQEFYIATLVILSLGSKAGYKSNQ